MAEDEIDITPSTIDPSGTGHAGLKKTVFQEREWFHILNNPGRLTKEGIQKKIELWKESNNKHVVLTYQTMLQQCPKDRVKPSGVDEEGRVIYAYDSKGKPRWVGEKTLKKK